MILVDMIGDAHLEIHREADSTPWLTDTVFTAAHRLGYAKYFLDSPTGCRRRPHSFCERRRGRRGPD